MAVLRTYRVRVNPARLAEYEAFERGEGVPMVASMPGCLRAGFARVREAAEPTFVFFSLWRDATDLERARATPEWKLVAARLESLGLSLGGDVAEHWEVVELRDGPVASSTAPARARNR